MLSAHYFSENFQQLLFYAKSPRQILILCGVAGYLKALERWNGLQGMKLVWEAANDKDNAVLSWKANCGDSRIFQLIKIMSKYLFSFLIKAFRFFLTTYISDTRGLVSLWEDYDYCHRSNLFVRGLLSLWEIWPLYEEPSLSVWGQYSNTLGPPFCKRHCTV